MKRSTTIIIVALLIGMGLVAVGWHYLLKPGGRDALDIAANPVFTPPTLSTNAADGYRQALRLFEQRPAPDADTSAQILGWVRAAATQPASDWGQASMEERLARNKGMRGLSRLVLDHAEQSIQQEDLADAQEDMFAALALGRHIGHDPVLVSKLMQVAIETQAIDLLAANLPRLSDEQLSLLPPRLQALPKSSSGAELMRGEFAFAQRSAREQQGEIVLAGMADGLEPFYKALADAWEQSPAQFASVVDEQIDALKLNPFAKTLGTSFKRARETIAVLEARRAMLRVAIDVLTEGESAIANSRDPFGDGPFGFVRTDTGFELRSKLQHNSAPVTLAVGGVR